MNKHKNFPKTLFKKITKIILKMSAILIAVVLASIIWISLDDNSIKTYETAPTEIIKIDPLSVEIGFDVTKPNKMDVKFEVPRRNSYTFSWMFYTLQSERPKKNYFIENLKSFFPFKPEYPAAEEVADKRRVLGLIEKIAKAEAKKARKTQQLVIAIPNHFELFAIEESGEKLVWDSGMERDRNERSGAVLNMGYGGYDIMIHFASPILEAGIYRFVLEVPKGVSEFVGTKTGIRINGDNRK